jgi:hypothetical protein
MLLSYGSISCDRIPEDAARSRPAATSAMPLADTVEDRRRSVSGMVAFQSMADRGTAKANALPLPSGPTS